LLILKYFQTQRSKEPKVKPLYGNFVSPFRMAPHSKMSLSIPIREKRHLEIIFQSLRPETEMHTTRSRTKLEKQSACMVLDIRAVDTVALRATSNAYLRWIQSLIDVLEILEAQHKEKPPLQSD
jgi:tRNA threonylcarbamoyladenosine modification (KEOPS) complex  Pcc1 subunit